MPLTGFSHYPHRVIKLDYLTANLRQFSRDCFQMLGDYIFYHDIPSGCRCCAHEGSSLNLVRNNGVFRTVKSGYAFYTNGICTSSLNIGSHAVQKVGYVYNMGLLCCIFKDGLTLRQSSRHHDVDGCSY